MIDHKQIEKSNTEKKSRQEELKETGYKDAYGSKKHCFYNKLNENIKINSHEHSSSDGKGIPPEIINDNPMPFKNHIKVINNSFQEHSKTGNITVKKENLKARRIECYTSEGDNQIKGNRLNYFALPYYGLEEKSTQTDFTSRELDNLKHVAEEFNSLKEEFLINFISNHPDVLKKVYYSALKKKDIPTRINVNLKRRINSKIHTKNHENKTSKLVKKEKKSLFLGEKSQETDVNVKAIIDDYPFAPVSDSIMGKVSNMNNIINITNNNLISNSVNAGKESPSPVSENFLNKKHLMENLLDSIDRTNKDDVMKANSDSPSFTPPISIKKEFFTDKFKKKQISLDKKIIKFQKKQRFDPFNFFKDEYIRSNPLKDQSTIEQVGYY